MVYYYVRKMFFFCLNSLAWEYELYGAIQSSNWVMHMELNFSQVFNWTDYVRRFWCYKFSCFFFEFLSERHGSVGMTAHKKQDLTARLQGHISNPVITTCNFITGGSYDLALQDQVMKICQLAWFNEIYNTSCYPRSSTETWGYRSGNPVNIEAQTLSAKVPFAMFHLMDRTVRGNNHKGQS